MFLQLRRGGPTATSSSGTSADSPGRFRWPPLTCGKVRRADLYWITVGDSQSARRPDGQKCSPMSRHLNARRYLHQLAACLLLFGVSEGRFVNPRSARLHQHGPKGLAYGLGAPAQEVINTTSVPSIVHQVFLAGEAEYKKLLDSDPRIKGYGESCRIHNPEWRFQLWTREDAEHLVREEYQWFWETWKNYTHWVSQCTMPSFN